MKPLRTWVLIADGARARIVENAGPAHSIVEVKGMEFQGDHADTHDLISDRQGRSYSSVGPGRSAVGERHDPHRELKVKFAQMLADVLAKGLEQDAYQRLIIVAPPVTLGDLRDACSDHVRAKIVGEVAHDLTKTPNNEVAEHIKDVLFAL